MRLNKFIFGLSSWVLLLSVGICHGQEGEVIIVSHEVELAGDMIEAKAKAHDEALVKALLQASQLIASPTLLTTNRALLEQKFSQDPKAFVQDYQFMQQRMFGNQYQLKLKVDPKWVFVRNKLTDWGFVGFQSKPEIYVAPFIVGQKENHKVTTSGEYWSSKVLSHLRSMGMRVGALDERIQAAERRYKVQGKIIRSAGKKVEFALLISNPKIKGNKQLVVSFDKGMSENMMAGMLGLTLIEQIMPIWFASQGNQRIYEIRLQNVDQYSVQQAFKQLMQSKRGVVQSIVDKKYVKGASVFEVHILQESLDLAKFLSSLQVAGKQVKVIEQSGRLIAIELQ